jgi:TM2 domain-containing membrane protein YozV
MEQQTNYTDSEKSWLVTLLLCVTFGYLGIHRFYTGHFFIGLIELFSLGGFGILWFLDMILIIIGSYKDRNGVPIKPGIVKAYREFVEYQAQQEQERNDTIEKLRPEIGDAAADMILAHQIGIDFTPEMVELSWGKPSNIDQIEIAKSGNNKERWVYNSLKRGKSASYIHFTRGKVVKIRT